MHRPAQGRCGKRHEVVAFHRAVARAGQRLDRKQTLVFGDAAMAGIGDWITGVLERDGAKVASVVPKEGGIQWTESYSIGKGSKNADIAKKFIQYMLSADGQAKSASMVAYPGFAVTKAGRKALNDKDPKEAQRTGQVDGAANDPVTLIKEGRIKYRGVPNQQSLEVWNDFWSEYKGS